MPFGVCSAFVSPCGHLSKRYELTEVYVPKKVKCLYGAALNATVAARARAAEKSFYGRFIGAAISIEP